VYAIVKIDDAIKSVLQDKNMAICLRDNNNKPLQKIFFADFRMRSKRRFIPLPTPPLQHLAVRCVCLSTSGVGSRVFTDFSSKINVSITPDDEAAI
jgi:hypothetical protein